MLKSFVAVSAGLVGGAHAFWRMECQGTLTTARLDPIMDPGKIASHVHYVHGSSGFSMNSDSDALLAGDCTSCRVTEDKSAYWHPSLYFEDAETGKFELVPEVGGMLAYYFLFGDNITAFPHGFQMLAGTNERRTYTAGDPSEPDPDKSSWGSLKETDQDELEQRALGFNCLNYEKTPEPTLYRHYMPEKEYLDANCKNGLRLEIMFPSCWKGPDHLSSDSHKDHVAYPDLVMNGVCPDDYPVRLPGLMYETIVDTASFSDRKGRFVFSNGDTTGFGYHADFATGWEEETLQSAIDTCTSPSGKITDCPVFTVVDETKARSCEIKLPKELSSEDVEGPLAKLPGNNPITTEADGDQEKDKDEDDEDDEGDDNSVTTSVAKPTLTYRPGTYPSDPASPLPGQIFKETSVAAAPEAPAVSAANVDPAAAEAPAPTDAPEGEAQPASYYSTQYVTDGNTVSKILWEEEIVYVTETNDSTTTVTALPSGAARRRRRSHMHGHGQRRHF